VNYKIAPSILSANFANLGQDVEKVIQAGADWIHVDVMDNHYVPNLTIGPLICRSLKEYGIKTFFDVHLMIEPVDAIVPAFVKAGANCITLHPDATKDVDQTIQLIKEQGSKVGLAFNPEAPLDNLEKYIDKIDLILIMSVHPGFAAQKFIENIIP